VARANSLDLVPCQPALDGVGQFIFSEGPERRLQSLLAEITAPNAPRSERRCRHGRRTILPHYEVAVVIDLHARRSGRLPTVGGGRIWSASPQHPRNILPRALDIGTYSAPPNLVRFEVPTPRFVMFLGLHHSVSVPERDHDNDRQGDARHRQDTSLDATTIRGRVVYEAVVLADQTRRGQPLPSLPRPRWRAVDGGSVWREATATHGFRPKGCGQVGCQDHPYDDCQPDNSPTPSHRSMMTQQSGTRYRHVCALPPDARRRREPTVEGVEGHGPAVDPIPEHRIVGQSACTSAAESAPPTSSPRAIPQRGDVTPPSWPGSSAAAHSGTSRVASVSAKSPLTRLSAHGRAHTGRRSASARRLCSQGKQTATAGLVKQDLLPLHGLVCALVRRTQLSLPDHPPERN